MKKRLTEGERFDELKMQRRFRDEAEWKDTPSHADNRRAAIIEAVSSIAEDIKLISKRAIKTGNVELQADLMIGLQQIRATARKLRISMSDFE